MIFLRELKYHHTVLEVNVENISLGCFGFILSLKLEIALGIPTGKSIKILEFIVSARLKDITKIRKKKLKTWSVVPD